MKLLITGGAGFIGSNFIRYTLEKHPEDQIVNLDLLTYAGNPENVGEAAQNPRYSFVHGDIADRAQVFRLFEREHFDAVVHFAAETHVDRSIADPEVFVRTNVMGTAVLLDAARTFGVRRFHQVSTDEVYGDLPLDRPELSFTENAPLRPSSPYSSSKASADLFVLAYCRTYGLPVTISRCSNNYGPRQFPEKLIPLVISHALEGKTIPVYGDGKNMRDWLYVEDHCDAIDRILRCGRAGEIYNVGGHAVCTNLELVQTLLHMLGKPDRLIRFVEDRPGHDRRYAVDTSKLETELGWSPQYNFKAGLQRTVDWYIR